MEDWGYGSYHLNHNNLKNHISDKKVGRE